MSFSLFIHSILINFPVVRRYPQSLEALVASVHIDQLQLPTLARRVFFDQINKNADITSDDVELEDYPAIEGKIPVFHSAVASFFSPSDEPESGHRNIYIY